MASYLNWEMLSMTLWLVRGGRHGEREKYAFENNLVVIGWESLPDLSRLQTKEELRTLYIKHLRLQETLIFQQILLPDILLLLI